jgi:integrase
VVSAIGRKAGVVVGQTDKWVNEDGKRVRKPVKMFAGAHDLRRGFCSRWARKVMPAVLQRLARHANIATTMGFYVSLSADEIGADLWADHKPTAPGNRPVGNTSGNTGAEMAENAKG